MTSLLKTMALGFGLLAGAAATADAQSISALPPTTPTAAAPAYSTTKIHPYAGGSQVWGQEPNQPTASYSIYPIPDGNTSGPGTQYQRIGPRPN
jgi:hypothetical protein